jgi:hypothetical protein
LLPTVSSVIIERSPLPRTMHHNPTNGDLFRRENKPHASDLSATYALSL